MSITMTPVMIRDAWDVIREQTEMFNKVAVGGVLHRDALPNWIVLEKFMNAHGYFMSANKLGHERWVCDPLLYAESERV